jgi:hypothetical protein
MMITIYGYYKLQEEIMKAFDLIALYECLKKTSI